MSNSKYLIQNLSDAGSFDKWDLPEQVISLFNCELPELPRATKSLESATARGARTLVMHFIPGGAPRAIAFRPFRTFTPNFIFCILLIYIFTPILFSPGFRLHLSSSFTQITHSHYALGPLLLAFLLIPAFLPNLSVITHILLFNRAYFRIYRFWIDYNSGLF